MPEKKRRERWGGDEHPGKRRRRRLMSNWWMRIFFMKYDVPALPVRGYCDNNGRIINGPAVAGVATNSRKD
jgi:hypothetical protein